MNAPALARLLPAMALAYLASASIGAPALAESSSLRNVLIIHSGAEDFPANPIMDAAIREALASRPDRPIAYFAEYLETEQFGEAEASRALGDYMRIKYRGRRIDLVIAITNVSLQFVLDHRGELFPGVPVVFGGLTVPDESIRSAGAGMAALRVGRAYSDTLKLALELHPSTKRVFVVAQSPNKQNVDTVHAELQPFSRQVELTYLIEPTIDRLVAAVKAVPPQSIILHIWHRPPLSAIEISPIDAARFVAQAAPVPVYGTVDSNVGTGMVGGVVRGTRETGTRLGNMARQILDGKRPQDIPVEAAPVVPTFDWRQLRRWGIDASRLPQASEIRFRVPTAWETYRWYVIAAITVVAAQLLLIAGLLAQRAHRRRAEKTIRNREATLRSSYERIRLLAGRLINAQEAARAGLARDLHDDLCQRLVYVSMAVGGLKISSGQIQDPDTQQAFTELEGDMLGVFDGIRRLSHDLHPATLRILGLVPALKAHCAEIEKRHNVQVNFKAEGDLKHLQPDVSGCLFRIAQESLRNAVVHGAARNLTVSVATSGSQVELTVTDDGSGFDLEAVRRNGAGLGLLSMEERARVVGCDVQIITGPGQGTTVRVRGPAEPSPAAPVPEDEPQTEAAPVERLPAVR